MRGYSNRLFRKPQPACAMSLSIVTRPGLAVAPPASTPARTGPGRPPHNRSMSISKVSCVSRAPSKHRHPRLRRLFQKPAVKAARIVVPACGLLAQLGDARAALGRKDYPKAWSACLTAVEERPFHPEAALLMAEIALAAGDGDSARLCAQQASTMAPRMEARQEISQRQSAWQSSPRLAHHAGELAQRRNCDPETFRLLNCQERGEVPWPMPQVHSVFGLANCSRRYRVH